MTIRFRRTALALLGATTLTITACSTDPGTDSEASGGTFTYAYDQEIDTYNWGTAAGYDTKNVIPLNRVLPGFWRFAPDGTIEPDTQFGSYEKTSDDPLTVEYTFDEEAVWSDGEPVDCDDAYLLYIANSGKYPQFDTAGTTGYDLIDDLDCADGDKAFTVTFSQPFADWEGLFGSFLPAHVLEREAGIGDFVGAAQAGDAGAMASAGEFWSTGWVFPPGELPDPSLIPANGPFKLSAWESGQSLTLVANDLWWGEAPKSDTVVIRFVAQDAQAQALENGEIQAMDPGPDSDILENLTDQGDRITIHQGDRLTYEQITMNFDAPVFADLRVRQAFASCVPRQQIVDNLIKPQNPSAVVMDSSYVFPFMPTYDEVVGQNGSDEYGQVDVARSQQLLGQAGVADPTVRVGFISDNQRRADTFQLIADSCGQAGFTVVDGSSPTFNDEDGDLINGNFDAAIYAWDGSTLVTGSSSIYRSDGGYNDGSYANPEVDVLLDQLDVTPNRDEQTPLIIQIEQHLWGDVATIPLFAYPGLAAWSSDASGVVFNASQAGLTWNMDEWSRG